MQWVLNALHKDAKPDMQVLIGPATQHSKVWISTNFRKPQLGTSSPNRPRKDHMVTSIFLPVLGLIVKGCKKF